MIVWLCVTTDDYQLPLAVADTAAELAEMCGVKPQTVHTVASKYRRGKLKRARYVSVKCEE